MADELQFDKAQFDAPEACRMCAEPISGLWYLANGKKVCLACRDEIHGRVTRPIGCSGYAMAIGAGGLVAVLCSIGWAVVRMVTGYELGIIAVGVGWVVATAMRRVARRGSLGLQFASMFLIYTAIVLSYIPELVKGMTEGDESINVILASVVAVPLAFGMPFFMLSEGGSGVFWFIIVGIAFFRAWRELTPPQVDFSGPFSR